MDISVPFLVMLPESLTRNVPSAASALADKGMHSPITNSIKHLLISEEKLQIRFIMISFRVIRKVLPIVAEVGGIQSQSAEGAAVASYCEPSATPDPKSSGFPVG
jgi:hypothetical protein